MRPAWRSSVPLLVALGLGAVLLFRDLGGPRLWADEADTAIFARNIVATGLPAAWDGRTLIDSDWGRRLVPHLFGADLVMVGTPWLPYYTAAGSTALLGASTGAARLPFALASLGTLALLYAFVLRATGCRRAALAAVVLLLASTQFLLYARECRSYPLNMFLTVLLFWGFLRLGERRGDPWLAVAAVLLFHTQIVPAAIAVGACGALALLHPHFRPRLAPLLRRAPFVAAGTLPWLAIAWSATRTNWKPLGAPLELLQRVAQLGLESMVAVPWLGWAVAIPLLWRRFRPGDRDLLAIGAAFLALLFVVLAPTLTQTLLLVVGIRYACGLLPMAAAVTGVLVARASDGRPLVYAALLVLFGATHLAGSALPWLAAGESRPLAGRMLFLNAPRTLAGKLLDTDWWDFVRSLGVRDPGTLSSLVSFTDAHVGPDQVVVTNEGWDALYFYTRARLGWRLVPEAPVWEAAHRLGLPDYVFGLDRVDWLLWHQGGDPLPGPTTFDGVRADLERRGARLERVAAFRETLYENRPELHWHRFAGVGYPYAPRRFGPGGARYPDVVAWRVVWPQEPGGGSH